MIGKTNLNKAMIVKKKPKRKSEHDTSTAVAAASGRALDLRTALEMEFPHLKNLCDLAECHGVLAQAHLIVRGGQIPVRGRLVPKNNNARQCL